MHVYVCVKSKEALSTPFLSGGSRGSKSQHWQGGRRGSVDVAGIELQAMMGSEHRARRGRDCHQGRVCTEVGVRQGEAWEDVSFGYDKKSEKTLENKWEPPSKRPLS